MANNCGCVLLFLVGCAIVSISIAIVQAIVVGLG